MAEKSYFFNSVNGDRKYSATDFADYFSPLVTNGFFPTENNLKIIPQDILGITVRSGRAWINGHQYVNTSDLNLTIDNADGVLNRIDRVVVQLNYSTREMRAVVKKGVFASSPTAPAIVRNADFYELGIALVHVNAGTTTLTQANITDTRNDINVGGSVNNIFADSNAKAVAVSLDDTSNFYVSSNVEGALNELVRPLTVRKTEEDTSGKFTTVRWYSNEVLVKESILSNADVDGNYQTRTVNLYAANGITIMKTIVFTLTYNASGSVINEAVV